MESDIIQSEVVMRNELGHFLKGSTGSMKRYSNAEDLTNAVLGYLDSCHDSKRPNMTGLALALGFRNRASLVAYQKEAGYEWAHDILAYAKMRIEEYLEQRFLDPKNGNVAGCIFSAKNNFNWVDKQDVRIDQRTMQLTGFKMIRNEDSGDTAEQDPAESLGQAGG